jgi:hypothetical protein
MSFSSPPEPLTPRQRTIFRIVALACAVTRFFAVSRSVWEWDEALFTMAMRDYDVTMHHPHPPGFPLFIAMAKLVRLVVPDDFRALQVINVIAAMLVFVAIFAFARELRLRFATCVSAGALFAFFPNVWFFGGGAFSDIPSIVLVLFAITLLLKGVRDRNAYWLGTLLLALAIGIRPQNLLVGLVPGFLATRNRRWWEILVALLIGVVIVGAAFGSAIYATGSLHEYQRMVREHGEYIARIDSFQSEDRPPLWRIVDRFFIKQYQSPVQHHRVALRRDLGCQRDPRAQPGPVHQRDGVRPVCDLRLAHARSLQHQPLLDRLPAHVRDLPADGIARVAKKREDALRRDGHRLLRVYAPALTSVRNDIARRSSRPRLPPNGRRAATSFSPVTQ